MSKEKALLERVSDIANRGVLLNAGEWVKIVAEINELLAQPEQETYQQGYRDGKAFANRHGEISLRDHFAGLVMHGLFHIYSQDYSRTISDKEIAEWSYEVADAMIKEREKINE